MRIIIGGALGRMGRVLATASEEMADASIVLGVDAAYQKQVMPFPMVAGYGEAGEPADVVIDFSAPGAVWELLVFCKKNKIPAVLCATGYTDDQLAAIDEAAKEVPLLRSANMSLGVQVMQELVKIATKVLGKNFDIEIVEKHHRMKADAPSGTALMLYEAASAEQPEAQPVHGWYGRKHLREKGNIGLHAVRGGTVAGEHEVGFYGAGEQVLLTHRAESRVIFAQGALQAARFLAKQAPGMYGMRDVVLEMLE